MRLSTSFVSLLLVAVAPFVACRAADAPGATAATEQLAAAAPRTLPSGHTFVAPEGFSLTRLEHAVVLRPPEGDTTITLVDVDDAADAGIVGVEFVVGSADGGQTLTLRDSQHEYVFVEQRPKVASR